MPTLRDMLRNYLAAALRHLSRNRLYAAISVFGLAVGLCAALLAGLYVRSEMTRDRFIPGYDRTFLAVSGGGPVDQEYTCNALSTVRLAPLLKLRFAGIEAVTRLVPAPANVRHDTVRATEQVYWADANAFDVLPLPVFSGDLKQALRRPDGVVIPRSIARKYFGREDAVGKQLLIDGTNAMTVTAVVEDLPLNGTGLETAIFASGLASGSALAQLERIHGSAQSSPFFAVNVRTYLRLAPGVSVDPLARDVREIARLQWPAIPSIAKLTLEFVRIDKVHLFEPLNPGIRGRLALAAIVGALILLIACVNFVNLLTVQSVRRAKEVGVRKMAGASRGTLVVQFLGESLLYVLLATLLGMVFTECALPQVNAFLGTGAKLDYLNDPSLLGAIVLFAGVLAMAVGFYPALVLSSLRPAVVLKGLRFQWPGANMVRQALVTLQFAILIGLIVAAGVVYEQRQYAMKDALRVQTDQVLIIRSACSEPLVSGLRALPGVRKVACSGAQVLDGRDSVAHFVRPSRSPLTFRLVRAELGLFDVYGVKPVAGALPDRVDTLPRNPERYLGNAPYILNETAARQFGFSSAHAVVGTRISTQSFGGPVEANLVPAVVPDFSLESVERVIEPTAYVVDPPLFSLINVKLAAGDLAPTLAAIDRLWEESGAAGPLDRFFVDEHVESLYRSLLREAQGFAVFSAVAVALACLGLMGLAAAMAERRTREIGIRKAMGADTRDVVRLLLWQFSKPVLMANVIAWPTAGYVMSRWLQGFAYRVDLNPWLFVGAAGVALAVALIAVSGQSFFASRAKPIAALRYE